MLFLVVGSFGLATLGTAQSGDPSMDPPAGSRITPARVAPMPTGGVRTVDGLSLHARIQAAVAPRRIAPGEGGVVHVILEAREGRALEDLSITVRSRSGDGTASTDADTTAAGLQVAHVRVADEQAATRVVPVPVTFGRDLPHGDFPIEVEVVACVVDLVEGRPMGRWRARIEADANLGLPLPRPQPKRSAVASPLGRPALVGSIVRSGDGVTAVDALADAPGTAVGHDLARRGAQRSDLAGGSGGWMTRWGWMFALLVPIVLATLATRWLLGARWWSADPRAPDRRG